MPQTMYTESEYREATRLMAQSGKRRAHAFREVIRLVVESGLMSEMKIGEICNEAWSIAKENVK